MMGFSAVFTFWEGFGNMDQKNQKYVLHKDSNLSK